ncbi:MAG: glycosyltransferase family 2 protein [Chitinophagaceae bacterium]|nr:glycosyltransferase family 2 protein [Chitinophagaceae bacterium]
MNISVVIICKNGSAHLAETLESVQGIGEEIILYDSGSDDGSVQIAKRYGARIETGSWEGYGRNRYKASQLAQYNWILMIDTDEVVDEDLKQAILNADLTNEHLVYNMRYKNYYGSTEIKFGEWGNDSHIRMANRNTVKIDQEIVHEKLFLQPGLHIKTLDGFIRHYTVSNSIDYACKAMEYASLSADKYIKQGRHSSFIKIYLSPLFSFLQNYIFKMGFRDGWKGFVCASMTAWYTFMKYTKLKELERPEIMKKTRDNKFEIDVSTQIKLSST